VKPIAYLSPEAVGVNPFTRKEWRNTTGAPVAIVKDFGSAQPGFVYCELESGEYLRVETGKGYLLGTYWVEGKR
jgi:hypothetical protein